MSAAIKLPASSSFYLVLLRSNAHLTRLKHGDEGLHCQPVVIHILVQLVGLSLDLRRDGQRRLGAQRLLLQLGPGLYRQANHMLYLLRHLTRQRAGCTLQTRVQQMRQVDEIGLAANCPILPCDELAILC